MSWPLISDFSRLLKNPKAAFRDPLLKGSTIELDNLGQPKPRSGNFATVYRAKCADGLNRAIRVFNRKADERRERYAACSRFFESNRLNCIVGFQYQEKGIRSASDNQMYPLVVMDWVEGVTLFEWIRDRCREGYQQALAIGADVWLELLRELTRSGVAHGDLQHANVMVTHEGHFKLVDYDGMATPELMGKRNIETGLPPYQHPQRNAETLLFPGLDNFSGLVIYVALKALAAAPHLWFAYVENPGYDRILFRSEDFQDPQQSRLYYDLLNSPDRMVRDLAHNLFQLSQYPLESVPPIDEVLLWCQSLDELVGAAQWDKVVQLVQRMGPAEQIPVHLQPHVQQAHQRVALRQALEEAYKRGDEETLQRLYQPELLQNYPDAADIALKSQQAPRVRRTLEVLRSAFQLRAWDKFRETWTANQQVLDDRPSAQPFRDQWEKLSAADRIKTLLANPHSDDQEVIECWRTLERTGGQSLAEGLEPQVQQRLARQKALIAWKNAVARAANPPTYESDQRLVQAWSTQHFDSWPLVAQQRGEFDLARRRVRLFEQCQDPGASGQTLQINGQELPDGYHPELQATLGRARQLQAARDQLERALAAAATEAATLRVWNRFQENHPDVLPSNDARERIELAQQRAPLIEQLSRLSMNAPPAMFDQKLVEIWQDELLEDCEEVDSWREHYALAKQRIGTLAQLQAALEKEDEQAARRLAKSSCLINYPLPARIREGLRQFEEVAEQQEKKRRQTLLNTLLNNDRKEFARSFDLAILREICRESAHHRPVVETWTESDVLPAFVKAAVNDDTGVSVGEDGRIQVRWNWPEQFATVRSRFKICEQPPGPRAAPETTESVYELLIYRRGWLADGEGHSLPAREEWGGYHVVVWGVFELGFQTLYTAPISVGQLPKKEKKRGWSLFGRSR